MKYKLSIFTMIFLISSTFSGCVTAPKYIEGNPKTTAVQAQELDKVNNTDSKKLKYEIIRKSEEDKDINIKIFYPQITSYPGQLLMDYMNQSLKKIVEQYNKKVMYANLNIDYTITKMDENTLSVLFKGTGKLSSSKTINIMQSINLDIKSSNEINFSNYIKNDQKSAEKVRVILSEKARTMGLHLDREIEGIRMYFENENVIFYYMPADDSATNFVEIKVPFEDLKGYINTTFGDRPAS